MKNETAANEAELRVLLSRVAGGDLKAFNLLYKRTRSKMLMVALLILRDREAAEDAVQEGYLSVWRRASTYRPIGNSISWMAAIMKNKAIDTYRARHPRAEIVSQDIRDLCPDPEQATMQSQREEGVSALVAMLDDKMRPVIVGAYVEGASYAAIAVRLGVPLNTVRTRLRRGLQELSDLARQAPMADKKAVSGLATQQLWRQRRRRPAIIDKGAVDLSIV